MRRLVLLFVVLVSVAVPPISMAVNDKKPAPEITVFHVQSGYAYHADKQCPALGRSKKIWESKLSFAVGARLSPCLRCMPPIPEASAIRVEKLLADPDKYDGRRIQVKGVVTDRAGEGDKAMFTVNDGGNKLAVSSPGKLPNVKDKVVVTGVFSKSAKRIDVTPIIGKVEPQSEKP